MKFFIATVFMMTLPFVPRAMAEDATQPVSVELPAEIRKGLQTFAESLGAGQTIQWDVVRDSPLTIAQGRKYFSGKVADVENVLRGTEHVTFTNQADFCVLEHFIDETDKSDPDKKVVRFSILYSYDGTKHYMHTANPGEGRSLSWATQAELIGTNYEDLDESYFRGIAVAMPVTPEKIDKKLPPRSVILNLIDRGARLTAVDHVTEDNRELVRLTIDATKKLTTYDIGWAISIFPLHNFPDLASNRYYLDPKNNYELVRSEHLDSDGLLTIRVQCQDYQQLDPRPVILPKTCVIEYFSPDAKGATETETITVKSFKTKALPAGSFTLHEERPGSYVLEHMDTDHQQLFLIQKDGMLKQQKIK